MRLKRSQLEDGIWATSPRPAHRAGEFLVHVKRILETDRGFGRLIRPASADQRAKCTFFSDAPPSSSAEVRFSSYEVFAALSALRLQDHGLPKACAMETLRPTRKTESEHRRTLEQNSAAIFGDAAPRKYRGPYLCMLLSERCESYSGHLIQVSKPQHEQLPGGFAAQPAEWAAFERANRNCSDLQAGGVKFGLVRQEASNAYIVSLIDI